MSLRDSLHSPSEFCSNSGEREMKLLSSGHYLKGMHQILWDGGSAAISLNIRSFSWLTMETQRTYVVGAHVKCL